ncbi:MAG: ATP-binding protein, partial [Thermodesulfobacteriota bacterium]|nr:ATP-binding protein [Thermodesulfobacteriota bacterium]
MKRVKKIIQQKSSARYSRNFLQPLTVALVMVGFVTLILVMGLMDLGRLDKTLVGFMENRGLDIITTVENVAQENLTYLYQTLKEDQEEDEFVPLTDKAFSPQESLVKTLVDLARDIDVKWKKELLSEKNLEEIAERENLWLIAVLNEEGMIVFQSREFLQDLPPKTSVVASRQEEIMIDLFNRFGKLDEIGYIALRRKDGSGTIVIALDDKGLRYWSSKIAVEKAIEEVGWGQGLAYLVVMDKYGKTLGRAGEVPEKFEEMDAISLDVLTGKLKKASRKMVFQEKRLLEIIVPVHLDEKVVGFARLGMDRAWGDGILLENRNRMITSMIFIMVIGILSMWALYKNQKRNAERVGEMEKQLQQAERLSALGQLAAGVAHEIRNPLNAISMASQRVRREYMPADEKKKKGFYHITGIIRDEIQRLNGIIEEFATFFRSRRLELSDHSVAYVLQKIISLMEEEAKSRGIRMEARYNDNNIMVLMDMDKMKQALYNILKNAMESIPGEGTISVLVEPNGRDKMSIRISDTGSGLTPADIDQIFNPEYTTKEKGLGLGLPLAHEIIRGHNGEIRVESQADSGTTFE